MESDVVVTLGKSTIQHGYFNDRIYLMSIQPEDVDAIAKRIRYLYHIYHYKKIVLKISESLVSFFKTNDMIEEARIPGFYQEGFDALFLSCFFDPERSHDDTCDQIHKTLQLSREADSSFSPKMPPLNIRIRKATIEDVYQISSLYRAAFSTYPFPIREPYYLKQIMKNGVVFCVGETSQGIIAAGSCEIDWYASAVEMSDLAVDDAWKGVGCSRLILAFMEQQMKECGVITAYTICRAEPLPVNRLFAGACYQYGGTLIKNTNICGKLESMNVWYKRLS